ncbi:MAG: CcmD family protein [Microscillaceae bacterium]|jgi:CcmD family protein|nr:CcmD family protein [Microscillaceae bacterium]
MKKLIFAFVFSLFLGINHLWAQSADKIEMADTMRANGKIYVVVAVLSIVLLGILIYLILIDRKITKLEREMK